MGSFRAEQEYSDQACGAEDRDQIKGPPPFNCMRDLPDEDWGEERAAEDGQVGECHTFASLL
ncbi:hypothetical protein RRF57_003868 [Xylaria bambusicola]|uniref:Uncharacterized protein n=1 Tax=Xylaria bambusicola TaxID=326684 RepID=A0AAN7UFS4_9PEZI